LWATTIDAYQICIYPGSRVPSYEYQRLQKELQTKTQQPVEILTGYDLCRSFPNDTYIVGHSFGGTFGILDAYKDRVRGLVLLNSHFNSDWVMPYPGLPITTEKNVLAILGDKDDRLPIEKCVGDIQNSPSNVVYRIIKNMTHFSGLSTHVDEVVDSIMEFINATEKNQTVRPRLTPDIEFLTRPFRLSGFVNIGESVGLLDALLRSSGMPCWKNLHFLWFLSSKPLNGLNFLYETSRDVLFKTDNVSVSELFPIHRPIVTKTIDLPTNLFSLARWLVCSPRIDQKNDRVEMQIYRFPIRDDVVYYKTPSRKRIFNGVSSFRRNHPPFE
jgi:hypothetical protein